MKRGFTFIELIVVIGIILVITGVVVVNYNSYNDRQRVVQSIANLKSDLRFAQTQAQGGKRPTSNPCDDFVGYSVTLNTGSYTISPSCLDTVDGNPYTYTESLTRSFMPGVSMTVPSSIPYQFLYYPLTRGTSLTDILTVTLENISGYEKSVTVSTSGIVSE